MELTLKPGTEILGYEYRVVLLPLLSFDYRIPKPFL